MSKDESHEGGSARFVAADLGADAGNVGRYDGVSFERWMDECDYGLYRRVGLHLSDLPDYAYRDAYNDDQTAADVVDAIIEYGI